MMLTLRACPRCHDGAVQTGRDEWGDPELRCVICGYRGPTRIGQGIEHEQGNHHHRMSTAQSAQRLEEARVRAENKRRGNPERTRRHQEAERAWERCLSCRHNNLTTGGLPGDQDRIICERRVHHTYVATGGLKMPNSKARAAILACKRWEAC